MTLLKKNIKSGIKVILSLFGKKYPIKVNFITTYKCNYECKYCNVKSLTEREMNTSEIKKMIDELHKVGMEQITFIGGEPLIRKDIGKLISYAKKKDILTLISTNGSLLKHRIKELKDLDVVALCLNGPKKVHDKIRGMGSYDEVIEAIDNAKKNNLNIILNCILYNKNKENIEHVLELAKEKSILVDFQTVFKSSLSNANNKQISYLKIKRKDIKEIFNYILKNKKQGNNIINSTPYLKQMAKYGNFSVNKCNVFKRSCAVSPSGIVGNCYKYLQNKNNNGNTIGWENAFYNIKKPFCEKCEDGCYIEDNLLFSLNISSIMNLFKIGKKAFEK
ncbi:MAG: radical SAM protein [Nanoarchaeota archaeon]